MWNNRQKGPYLAVFLRGQVETVFGNMQPGLPQQTKQNCIKLCKTSVRNTLA